MIRIVTGRDAEIGQWIGEKLGMYLGAGAALGFAENGKLLAGIHYTIMGRPWASCEMSIFAESPRWASRGVRIVVTKAARDFAEAARNDPRQAGQIRARLTEILRQK